MKKHQVILFDGVCNFCNFWVNFVIDRDKNDLYRLATLQSGAGQEILSKFDLNKTYLDTFVLVIGNQYFIKSTAALSISKNLSGIVKLLYPFIFLPKFLRDFAYDLIARNRYKLFGKRDVCRVPGVDEKKKFIY
jgi:predicted DCC family thiol-disulfide oxidoreductase YuxK